MSVGGRGRVTDLMLRVSHPRTEVSLAVATWVQLWCGLHRPAVNFSCPLPSREAELASWESHVGARGERGCQ